MNEQTAFWPRAGVRCFCCGRSLTHPVSVKRGIGPVCSGRGYKTNGGGSMAGDSSFSDLKLIGVPLTDGIILERASDGSVVTNIPHLVVEHSPTGFNFGYGGSGPADLALNIVEAVLRRMDYQGEKMRCFDGRCFALAYQLHQNFKWEFVATVKGRGAAIPYKTVEMWVRERMGTDEQGAN